MKQDFEIKLNYSKAPCCACHDCWHKHGEGYHVYCEYHAKETWKSDRPSPQEPLPWETWLLFAISKHHGCFDTEVEPCSKCYSLKREILSRFQERGGEK